MTNPTTLAVETENTFQKTELDKALASVEAVKARFTAAERAALYLDLISGGREITTF